MTGTTLPPHNPEKSTDQAISCPSNLNLKKARNHKDFVVTSCTNDSPVVKPFIAAIKRFIDHKNGQLLVVPLRYKNPNAMSASQTYKWASEIYDYALLEDLHINSSLVISGLRLQATAVNPLSGLQPNSGTKSAIYGHPQLAMEMVATAGTELPKMMHTTGSISRPRYSATKAGGKAKFHHSLSAVYVKVVGSKFYIIQLTWDGNGFYYLDEYWTEDGLESKASPKAMVIKDLHQVHEDKKITKATERVKAALKPETLVWHDILDFNCQSHHNTLIEKIKLAESGGDKVHKEVLQCVKYIEKYGAGYENLIVQSNHHDHMDQWVNRFDPNKDPGNALFYSALLHDLVTTDKSALELCFDKMLDKNKCQVKFLSRNKPHKIGKIDVSQHGDIGSNGSRGSAKAIAKTSSKSFIGHSHTPCIEKGCWQVGTHNLNLAYAKGLSSWAVCDGLIYPNSKRAHLFYINGKSLVDLK